MSSPAKTVAFDELIRIVQKLREDGQTVVHCHGVFDLLHIGHIRYFQAAKRRGDYLVVTVTPDHFVNKGPHRPVFDQKLRVEAIAALEGVDFIAVNEWPTAVEALRRLRPTVYAKGAEFRDRKTPEIVAEEAEAVAIGVRVEFIDDDVTSSSSYLINHFLSPFSEEVNAYLSRMRQRWPSGEFAHFLDLARNLRVLVVGEAILDDYVFCETVGQSTKSPHVVGRLQTEERFLGGALSVANHLAGFCREITLVTALGDEPAIEEQLRSRLRPEVSPSWVIRRQVPTTVKRQFRDAYFASVLFELNLLDDSPPAPSEEEALQQRLRAAMSTVDLVVVADYGHGLLSDATLALLADSAPFLAITTPASAANLGFHTISRYPRADFLAMAEQDLRLDQRQRDGEVEPMLASLARRLGTQRSLLTVGSRGSICFSESQGFVTAPALATRVVDRLGAAEAAFAVTSVGAKLELPLESLAFLSNVAGAQSVAVMGNSRFLDALSFRRSIESLLK